MAGCYTTDAVQDASLYSAVQDLESEGEQEAEDWERHEALQHDDHEEYLYEQEIELKWEKGGSGLVFWTGTHARLRGPHGETHPRFRRGVLGCPE